MKDPQVVLKRLSPAGRRALCGIPEKRDFMPDHTGFQWPTLATLKAHRLINGVQCGTAGYGKFAWHRLTPLGRAVRALAIEVDAA